LWEYEPEFALIRFEWGVLQFCERPTKKKPQTIKWVNKASWKGKAMVRVPVAELPLGMRSATPGFALPAGPNHKVVVKHAFEPNARKLFGSSVVDSGTNVTREQIADFAIKSNGAKEWPREATVQQQTGPGEKRQPESPLQPPPAKKIVAEKKNSKNRIVRTIILEHDISEPEQLKAEMERRGFVRPEWCPKVTRSEWARPNAYLAIGGRCGRCGTAGKDKAACGTTLSGSIKRGTRTLKLSIPADTLHIDGATVSWPREIAYDQKASAAIEDEGAEE
jgi:hypothetical protein